MKAPAHKVDQQLAQDGQGLVAQQGQQPGQGGKINVLLRQQVEAQDGREIKNHGQKPDHKLQAAAQEKQDGQRDPLHREKPQRSVTRREYLGASRLHRISRKDTGGIAAPR